MSSPSGSSTRALRRDLALPGVGTIALITLDNGQDHTRPTTLDAEALHSLGATLDQVAADTDELAGVAITGKPHVFCVGADLTHAAGVRTAQQARDIAELGHQHFRRMAELPVPTAAFLNGPTLGGGLELALHADYRTCTANIRALGLPEVALGLIPGWGGSWLLPTLIGPAPALDIMLHNPLRLNRQLTAAQALELGVVDATFDPATFLEESLAWFAEVI
ncbi:MAG: enoyl-CoA hydratase/isomerase family protein, partial [Angustibacter sp.]